MDLNYILGKAQAAPLAHRGNAAKEALQECLLARLAQEGLLAGTAFIGGTALRILHGLPRFSEDLDFVCRESRPDLAGWQKILSRYLTKIGLTPHLQPAHLHTDEVSGKRTQALFLAVTSPALAPFAREGLQISFEFDYDPPAHTREEVKTLAVAHSQATVPTLDLPSLMAGKLHILLTRRDREKGRDWYDYLWYRDRVVTPNVAQLQSAIEQTKGTIPEDCWMCHLRQRMGEVNWPTIRQDVLPFLEKAAEADRLNEVTLGHLTPPPPIEELAEAVRRQGAGHYLVTAGAGNPVRQDIERCAFEGEMAAIDLRDQLAALREA